MLSLFPLHRETVSSSDRDDGAVLNRRLSIGAPRHP